MHRLALLLTCVAVPLFAGEPTEITVEPHWLAEDSHASHRLWDLRAGKAVWAGDQASWTTDVEDRRRTAFQRSLSAFTFAALSDQGRLALGLPGRTVVVTDAKGKREHTLVLPLTRDGKPLMLPATGARPMTARDVAIRGLAFSPDGQKLAVTYELVRRYPRRSTPNTAVCIAEWSVADGTLHRRHDSWSWVNGELLERNVSAPCYLADGRLAWIRWSRKVISAQRRAPGVGLLEAWGSGAPVELDRWKGGSSGPRLLAQSGDRKVLALSSDGNHPTKVRVWRDGKFAFTIDHQCIYNHSAPMSILGDELWFVTREGLARWRLADGAPLPAPTVPEDEARRSFGLRSGLCLISGWTVRIFDAAMSERARIDLRRTKVPFSIQAVSPNGRFALSREVAR